METVKRCIVIQGPTNSNHVLENKKCWNSFPIIFSTWINSDKSAYDLNNDIVLFNKYPLHCGVANWEYQRISTLNGLKKAKELGFKRALKWRSDFKTNNGYKLLELFELDKINFYAFIKHRDGYVADFFVEGDIDELINLFDTEKNGTYPEQILTNRLYELNLNKKSNFICKLLNDDADVYWHKYKYWFKKNICENSYSDKII